MNAADFAQYIDGSQRHQTERGTYWTGLCLAHDDHNASLSWRDGDRAVMLKCHAGCAPRAILDRLGLTFADLKLAASSATTTNGARARRMVAEYEYHNADGSLAYQVVRYEPKDFRQRIPNGRGGWTWSLHGTRRVVYRLPMLTSAKVVYICEGERDCDRLWGLGLRATTNAGGAEKWTDDYTAQLTAAGIERVVILPDNDAPGEAHALGIARSCLAAGLGVKVVRLPGLAPKGDVSDWLDAAHTKAELGALVKATEPLTVATLAAPSAPRDPHRLTFTSLGDLLAEPEEDHPWLVEDRLPAGGLGLLAGKPKAGKSTAARCLALSVARGAEWLGFKTHQGSVFYLGLEEKRQEVKRHFQAMGARAGDPVHVFIAPSPEDGMAQLRATAEAERPALIVVDPLLRFVRVRDANDYAMVTAALEPLMAIARDTGACVLAVHHMGKGERSGGDAILGSTAIFGAVDTALLLRRSDKYRTLSSTQRYGTDLEEMVVVLDEETRTVQAGTSRAEADEQQAAAAILDYLGTLSEPVEESEIREAVQVQTKMQVRALRTLVTGGEVIREGTGKRGDPYCYSVSCSLVPTYIREQENKKCETAVSARESEGESCSREITPSAQLSEPREQETALLEDIPL